MPSKKLYMEQLGFIPDAETVERAQQRYKGYTLVSLQALNSLNGRKLLKAPYDRDLMARIYSIRIAMLLQGGGKESRTPKASPLAEVQAPSRRQSGGSSKTNGANGTAAVSTDGSKTPSGRARPALVRRRA